MKPLLYVSLALYCSTLVTVGFHHMTRKRPLVGLFEVVSKSLLTLGLLLHTIALSIRTYETGHAPMASLFETLLFYSWCTVLTSVVVIYRYRERTTEVVTVPCAVVALIFALLNETEGKPLTLVLMTHWFELHVTASFAAYALFTLAFSGAVLFLIHELKKEADPELMKKFQEIAGRSILWGFFLFSLWEPKVIWSFIVWFYYAGAMHAYYVKEWRGRGLSVATVFGFFVVLFTYLGVSLLMKSSHSF
jgi:ABC-type transport system involved in cytochrome c biogenesis permease subunit